MQAIISEFTVLIELLNIYVFYELIKKRIYNYFKK